MAPRQPVRNRGKQLGVVLPVPLNVRLDRLLERVRAAGERTSRKELVAALIDGAPRHGTELHPLLRSVRTAPVGAAVLPGDKPETYLVAERRPGPRPALGAGDEGVDDQPQLFRAESAAVDPDAPLHRVEGRRVGLAVPPYVDRRLDELVRRIEGDGGSTTRGEVLAALLLAAPDHSEELVAMLRRHRLSARRHRTQSKRRR